MLLLLYMGFNEMSYMVLAVLYMVVNFKYSSEQVTLTISVGW
jgi:hypothetical protein